MPLRKLSIFAYVISQKQSANQQKQSHNNTPHVKTSQSAKNQLNPAKNKNQPKMLNTPFLRKSLQLYRTILF